MNLNAAFESASEDIEAVTEWCTSLYNRVFASYFQESRELSTRLKSKERPITDEELSWILIQLPVTLFDVSECVNQLRVSQEVVKMRNRQIELQLAKDKSGYDMSSDKLLVSAYNSVITRVENEISFSRELIMGAKKIWDARRRSEQSNPVSEVEDPSDSLPDYTFDKPHTRR